MSDIFDMIIGEWLDTRDAPGGKTAEELAKLRADIIEAVRQHAPATNQSRYAGQVLERAWMGTKGRGWPEFEQWVIASTGVKQETKGAPERPREPVQATSAAQRAYETFIARVNASQPVGEPELFSTKIAGRALREGRIQYADLRPYQISAYRQRVKIYGREQSIDWLRNMAPKLAAEMENETARDYQDARMPYAEGDFE